MQKADEPLRRLGTLLAAGDQQALASFTAKELYPSIDPLSEQFAKLIEVQLHESERQYQAGVALYQRNFNLVAGLLALLLMSSSALVMLLLPLWQWWQAHRTPVATLQSDPT